MAASGQHCTSFTCEEKAMCSINYNNMFTPLTGSVHFQFILRRCSEPCGHLAAGRAGDTSLATLTTHARRRQVNKEDRKDLGAAGPGAGLRAGTPRPAVGAGADVDGLQGTVPVPGFHLGHPWRLRGHRGDCSQSCPPVFPTQASLRPRVGVVVTAAAAEHQGAVSAPCPWGGSPHEGPRAKQETGYL